MNFSVKMLMKFLHEFFVLMLNMIILVTISALFSKEGQIRKIFQYK